MLLGQNLKILDFITFLLTSILKNCLGILFHPPSPPPPPPRPHLCIYGSTLHLDFQVLEKKNIFAIEYLDLFIPSD